MATSCMTVNDYGMPDCFDNEISCGTTILAIQYDGGVIIGADSRTSSGVYIVNKVANKLTKITDKIYCCRSGSAADTQAIADIVKFRTRLLSLELNEEPTVKLVAHNFKDICYKNRDNISAGIIVGGWDEKKGGQVYCIPLGGMLTQESVALGGSGSGYIHGFVDANKRPNMTQAEAEEFALKALTLAMRRDGSSGGCVRIGIINKDGCQTKLFRGNELPVFAL